MVTVRSGTVVVVVRATALVDVLSTAGDDVDVDDPSCPVVELVGDEEGVPIEHAAVRSATAKMPTASFHMGAI